MATYKLKTFTVQFEVREQARVNRALRSSDDVYQWSRGIYENMDVNKEHFTVFFLNNKNRLIDDNAFKVVSTGSLTASLVHPREVFQGVIASGAAAMVCVHNHPSGDPAPSPEDIEITRRLKQCAEVFGVRFLDHVVIGDGRYYSFSDRGIL